MIRLFKFFKTKEWCIVTVSILFIVGQVFLDLKLPDYMSEITMLVQTPNSAMSEILTAGGYMLICALSSMALAMLVGYFAATLAATQSKRIRSTLFKKVESFSMAEMNQFSTSSLITRSTNDITQVQMIIAMGLQIMIKAPILGFWAVIKISNKSWQWSAATGVAVAFMLTVISILMVLVIPRFKKIQALTDNLNRVTRETLTGIRVVRAYNAEKFQEAKFEEANTAFTSNNLFAQRSMSIMWPMMSIVLNGLTLSIYWIGAILINQAALTNRIGLFSDMVVFSSYAMQVIMAFMMMIMIFIMLPRASVSAKRILEVLDTKSTIFDGTIDNSPNNIKGEIEFKNVSFKYPDADNPVLENISFTAKKGETVAFIGSTGCGKSSLINLIPRFYNATSGQVLVNGIDVKDYTLKFLHEKISYVSQKSVIFSGTVSSNVTFGSGDDINSSLSQIKKAISIAQGTEFVENMKDQYDSQIAQGGTNISGGQKQRLSIARAIYRKPEIILFDDSFSALDFKTDRILRDTLKKETQGITSLIVAQRIGTIRGADKIIVLDEGKMVGMGTHDQLMESCDVYKEIAHSQLSKEELGA